MTTCTVKQNIFGALRSSALAAAFLAFIIPASAGLAFAVSTATVVGITSPADGAYLHTLPSITGAASSGVGVASVTISIQSAADGKYWNGSAWTSSYLEFGVPYSTVTQTWSYSFLPVWVSSAPYTVLAQARNTVGDHSDIASSTFYFYPGNTAPSIVSLTATPSSVPPSASADVVCIASDAESGSGSLSYVWTQTAGVITGSGPSVTWTAVAATGTVTVNCEVSDGSLTAQRSVQITVAVPDNTAPLAGVATPANGSSVSSLPVITGTSSDAVGVTSVKVAVKRQSDNKYWTGTAWDATPVWNSASGTTSWTYAGISGATLDSGLYVAMCRAYDAAGNVSIVNS